MRRNARIGSCCHLLSSDIADSFPKPISSSVCFGSGDSESSRSSYHSDCESLWPNTGCSTDDCRHSNPRPNPCARSASALRSSGSSSISSLSPSSFSSPSLTTSAVGSTQLWDQDDSPPPSSLHTLPFHLTVFYLFCHSVTQRFDES